MIGVYASETDAREAVARLKDQPGAHLSGFEIDEYEIGKDHWVPNEKQGSRRSDKQARSSVRAEVAMDLDVRELDTKKS